MLLGNNTLHISLFRIQSISTSVLFGAQWHIINMLNIQSVAIEQSHELHGAILVFVVAQNQLPICFFGKSHMQVAFTLLPY